MTVRATVFTRNDQALVAVTPALRALVRRAIKATLAYEKFEAKAEVSVTFTDNEGIHALNLAHRGIDRATDVLSFPLFDGEDYDTDGDAVLLGDIVLSLERAGEQALEYRHSFEREVAFLTVHSTLHLLGYDHETSKEDEEEMFARQDAILIGMGLTRS